MDYPAKPRKKNSNLLTQFRNATSFLLRNGRFCATIAKTRYNKIWQNIAQYYKSTKNERNTTLVCLEVRQVINHCLMMSLNTQTIPQTIYLPHKNVFIFGHVVFNNDIFLQLSVHFIYNVIRKGFINFSGLYSKSIFLRFAVNFVNCLVYISTDKKNSKYWTLNCWTTKLYKPKNEALWMPAQLLPYKYSDNIILNPTLTI